MRRARLALAIGAWLVRLALVVVVLAWNVAAWIVLLVEHRWLVESPWSWCGPLAVQSACR